MTTSSTTAKTGGARVGVQKFGTFVSGMVMPNIAAFIAWGFITALFIQTGWLPLLGIDPVWVQQLGGWSLDPDVESSERLQRWGSSSVQVFRSSSVP